MSQLTQQLLDRFLRYVNIPSQSKAGVAAVPSTPDQWHMAQQLEAELEVMDLENIQLSDRCVLTGMLPANLPAGFTGTVPKIGFCCHLDTVDVNLSPQVHPQVIRNYPGGDVVLNADKNIVMKLPTIRNWRTMWARTLCSPMAPASWGPTTRPPWPM